MSDDKKPKKFAGGMTLGEINKKLGEGLSKHHADEKALPKKHNVKKGEYVIDTDPRKADD